MEWISEGAWWVSPRIRFEDKEEQGPPGSNRGIHHWFSHVGNPWGETSGESPQDIPKLHFQSGHMIFSKPKAVH